MDDFLRTSIKENMKMYYRDHNNKLCFDDGKNDWFVDERTGEMQKADWFWYLEVTTCSTTRPTPPQKSRALSMASSFSTVVSPAASSSSQTPGARPRAGNRPRGISRGAAGRRAAFRR